MVYVVGEGVLRVTSRTCFRNDSKCLFRLIISKAGQ